MGPFKLLHFASAFYGIESRGESHLRKESEYGIARGYRKKENDPRF